MVFGFRRSKKKKGAAAPSSLAPAPGGEAPVPPSQLQIVAEASSSTLGLSAAQARKARHAKEQADLEVCERRGCLNWPARPIVTTSHHRPPQRPFPRGSNRRPTRKPSCSVATKPRGTGRSETPRHRYLRRATPDRRPLAQPPRRRRWSTSRRRLWTRCDLRMRLASPQAQVSVVPYHTVPYHTQYDARTVPYLCMWYLARSLEVPAPSLSLALAPSCLHEPSHFAGRRRAQEGRGR